MIKRILLVILCLGLMPASVWAQSIAASKQGQSQGIVGDFGIQDSFNSEKPEFFAIPVDVYNAQLAPHFGGPNYKDLGANFTSITTILTIAKTWNVQALGTARGRQWGDTLWDGMVVSCEVFSDVPRNDERELYSAINVDKVRPEQAEGLGMCTVRATSDQITSMSVFKEGLRQVHGMGGNTMQVVSEGGAKELEAWGIGIGVSYVAANQSVSGDTAGTGAGGTGINFAESHYETLPWIQFVTYLAK